MTDTPRPFGDDLDAAMREAFTPAWFARMDAQMAENAKQAAALRATIRRIVRERGLVLPVELKQPRRRTTVRRLAGK